MLAFLKGKKLIALISFGAYRLVGTIKRSFKLDSKTISGIATAMKSVPLNFNNRQKGGESMEEQKPLMIEPMLLDMPAVREVEGLPIVFHNNKYDAGYDVFAIEDMLFWPYQTKVAKTNVRLQVPPGFQVRVAGRSGMAKDDWLTHHGSVDCGYTGNIGVILKNMKLRPRKIFRGQRIAQLQLIPIAYMNILETDTLEETTRGSKGFGSSGKF